MHNRTGDRSAVPPNIRSRRMPSSAQPVIPRRPRKRGRRPRTYAAVLAATSRLLESVPLSDLSVAQILEAAGVGRTSFYEHFSSKEDVVVKLMRSVSLEVALEIEPMFDRGERSPDEALAEGIENLMRVGSRYAPLLVAASEEWPGVSELREIWFAMLADATARLGATIERDRAAGVAPPGADSEALAASLMWSAERTFHVAMTGEHAVLVDPETLVEPLVALFVGAIYGRPAAEVPGVPGAGGVATP
jgi:TetR/AcrR family transcriptional regulator, ethionamide resistance regulator